MKVKRRARAVALAATLGLVGTTGVAAPAMAGAGGNGRGHHGVRVVASGLDGPFGLDALRRHRFLVAEGDAGDVTIVGRHGRQRAIISDAAGVAGVAAGRKVFAVLGGGDETGPAPDSAYPASSVLRSDYRGRHVKVIADLAKYELDNNPDGQVQFSDEGTPYDALSNPFSMNLSKYGLLVADGGANDVLKVNPRTGRVSTFFVPPTVTDVEACLAPEAQANPGTVGCDPVPTGIAVARGSVYVSTLGAEVPGAGRVYRLNPRTGRVQHVYKNLTSPTGVAVSPRGTVYISEVLFGLPEGPPPDDLDITTIGRITKIGRHGRQSHVRVTTPTGLDFRRGHLYASTGSLAGPGAGEIVRIGSRAFHHHR
jgi:hypothetical protein